MSKHVAILTTTPNTMAEVTIKPTDQNGHPTGEAVYQAALRTRSEDVPADLEKPNGSVVWQLFCEHEWRVDCVWAKQADGTYHAPVGETLARRQGR